MIRVLQIGMSNNKGGIESFVMNYYRRMDHEEIQFDFIDNYGKLAFSDEIKTNGGRIIGISDFHKNPLNYFLTLKKVMIDYEIVHINMLSLANVLPVIAAKFARVKKVIVHAHSTQALGDNRQRLDIINKKLTKRMMLVRLACSEKAGKWMFPDSDFEIIKNAIDIKKYAFNEKSRIIMRKELGIKEEEFVFGNVAALMEEKNHRFLLKVFSEFLKFRQDALLLIVGVGELMDTLKKEAEELNIFDKVLFLGSRNDVYMLYNVFDCFLLPSFFEGTPFTLIEAQTNGLKCYVSKNRVSRDNDLIGTMQFIGLEDGECVWAKSINEGNNQRVENSEDMVYSLGFDIHSQIEKLVQIYNG